MSSEVLTQALVAGQQATFPQGRIFNILSAPSGPLTIQAVQAGGTASKVRNFNNVPAGSKFTAKEGDGWTYLRVTSQVNQTVTIFVGDDDMSFNNAVTITGTAATEDLPASTLSDLPPVVTVAATQAQLFPANSNRRRITVFNKPTNAGDVNGLALRKTGGTKDLAYLTPGQSLTFVGTYGVDYNATVGGDTIALCEES
jgi:hypothetical protein